ncbi:unnamed protein product [Dovyalis caffra]|uniref:Uncharacterized protein n=1 Tax=Dovyalis caffra TaxID=77055 RepID=A0AAV1SLS8_9ROSI|nr:unnamed protein product [Dovyalis caffra]
MAPSKASLQFPNLPLTHSLATDHAHPSTLWAAGFVGYWMELAQFQRPPVLSRSRNP